MKITVKHRCYTGSFYFIVFYSDSKLAQHIFLYLGIPYSAMWCVPPLSSNPTRNIGHSMSRVLQSLTSGFEPVDMPQQSSWVLCRSLQNSSAGSVSPSTSFIEEYILPASNSITKLLDKQQGIKEKIQYNKVVRGCN